MGCPFSTNVSANVFGVADSWVQSAPSLSRGAALPALWKAGFCQSARTDEASREKAPLDSYRATAGRRRPPAARAAAGPIATPTVVELPLVPSEAVDLPWAKPGQRIPAWNPPPTDPRRWGNSGCCFLFSAV